MEKLQPFLKQRYWICFGLALIFVLAGWWSASGDLATRTADRKKSVEESFASADKGKTEPNESWVAGGKKENELDSISYKTASLQLWKRQQAAREWPEQIRSEMQKIGYFAEVNSKETRERWVSIYQTQIEDLLKIVKPFQPDTGEGLVLVDADRITRQPYDKWQIDYPSSNEIWSNQEDIWLLKALLTSISKANDSATRITESQVREIRRLTLRGGDRNTKPGAVGGGMGGGMMGGIMGGAMADGAKGMSDGPAASSQPEASSRRDMWGQSGGAAAHSHPGSAYEGNSRGDVLNEEFGPVVSGAGMEAFGGDAGGKMIPMGVGEGAVARKEVRYVDDAEKDQGYKTRAFLLDVVIRDERLPDLLAKLTNSDFPVEIVRVEIMSRSVGGGMPGGGMSGGGMRMPGGGMLAGGMGMPGGLSGGFGAMSPGKGGGAGGFPGLGGMPGVGGYRGEDEVGGYRGEDGDSDIVGVGAAGGVEVMNAALADPLLIEVSIGGLLTLYMTPEESERQAKTEETAAKEAVKSAPAGTAGTLGASETANSVNPGSEVPATGSAQDISIPEAPVPDATQVETPADDSVPGHSVSPELSHPQTKGEGSSDTLTNDNDTGGTSPLGGTTP